jgi:hypothetical protein
MFLYTKAKTYEPGIACRPIKEPTTASMSGSTRAAGWFFTPVLAPMLQNRRLVIILTVLGIGQIGLSASGLRGWQCPINCTLDITCPGCGLTNAIAMLLEGDWSSAVRTHAFAPLVLMVLIFMSVASILPIRYQRQLSMSTASLERQTGIAAIGLISMIAYWLLRLAGII